MVGQKNETKILRLLVVCAVVAFVVAGIQRQERFLTRHEVEYNEEIITPHYPQSDTGPANYDDIIDDKMHENANTTNTMQGSDQKEHSEKGGNSFGLFPSNNNSVHMIPTGISEKINTEMNDDGDVKALAEPEIEVNELPTTKALTSDDNAVYIDAFPDLSTISNIKTYENLTSLINFDIPVPNNLNILFFGDSLSRYQYLDLVYFLSHGAWVDPDDHSSLVWAGNHSTWNAFYNFTNFNLKPYEECDCFRNEGIMNHRLLNENRYFRDAERNNSVTYLQKFGTAQFKSAWNVTDIHKNHTLVQNARDVKYFGHTDWLGAIEEFICKMDPKPSMVFLNSGLWGDGGFADPKMQGNVVDALRGCGITSVYKTTTKKKIEQDSIMRDYEEQMCNQTDMCYDIGWTGPLVPEEFYRDRSHMISPIYSMLNVQLLSMLASREQHEKEAQVEPIEQS